MVMRFAEKLDALPATATAATQTDIASLAIRLAESRGRSTIAIGSGGSAVAAEFLALCRTTIGRGVTLVQTPLEFSLGLSHLHETDVWLFSAGGDNHDILGALTAARHRGPHSLTIVTANPKAQLVEGSQALRDVVTLITPRAEPNDGFLATHSLLGAVIALLRASAFVANGMDHLTLGEEICRTTAERLSAQARRSMREALSGTADAATIHLLHDPRLAAAAVMIETSLWEAAICAVQRTDFRNFAHGRHVWLEKRAAESFIIALTGQETSPVWEQISNVLPSRIGRSNFDFGRCSRFDCYLAIIDAFAIVESLASFRNIDPGKPGVGEFARPIYDADTLAKLSQDLTAPVRQKRFICAHHDEIGTPVAHLPTAYREVLARLENASFGGLVLDYDGTVVATDHRFEPPTAAMVEQLAHLLDEGLRLGIATGRGGSAGEDLRKVLPERHHSQIVMGYYNGAHVALLSEDIRERPPLPHAGVQRAIEWARSRADLIDGEFKNSLVQATIDTKYIRSPNAFVADFAAAPFDGQKQLKLVRSRHSFDICPIEACKTNVVYAVKEGLAPSQEVLCIGDSGGDSGNDHIMLGLPFGISVDHVCSREHVGWSLFGTECTGPDALLRILAAMTKDNSGGFSIQTSSLLDS
jgi:hydroxymethylpyrimidine pyrophosphatase-like HAD family hydrolase